MNLVECFNYKITFPSTKKRNKEFWAVDKHPELKEGIECCLRTGKQQVIQDRAHLLVWIVEPRWPSLALTYEQAAKERLLKVTVRMFTESFSLGVEGTPEEIVAEPPKEKVFGGCGLAGCAAVNRKVNCDLCRDCRRIRDESDKSLRFFQMK